MNNAAMHLPLLQTNYLQESDPRQIIIFLVVIAVIVIIVVVSNIIRNGLPSKNTSKSSSSKSGTRKYSKWALIRSASAIGLSKEEIDLLDHIFRKAGLNNPEKALLNPDLLDRVFTKGLKDIELHAESEQEAEYQKSLLFSVRSRAEASHNAVKRYSNTHRLPDGCAVTLTIQDGENYPSRVITAKNEQLYLEMPTNALGTPVKFSKSSKISVSFYSNSNQGYSFTSKVLGTRNSSNGYILVLSHSDAVKALPGRRHRRTVVTISCLFYRVRIDIRQVGKKTEKHTTVDDKRNIGTIMDISAGGCSVKTAVAIRSGEYIKIDFTDPHGVSQSAIGRIVRTNRAGAIGGIMHIQFLKASRKTLNAIQAIVYGYYQD